MHKQIKFSLWDAFSYYVAGWVVLVSLGLHIYGANTDVKLQLDAVDGMVLGLALFLLPLIFGLFVEPLANLSEKLLGPLLSSLVQRVARFFSRGNQVPTARSLRELAEETIPEEIRSSISSYHWCKNYLDQQGVVTNYMTFLAKFGFYRNIAFVFAANALSIPMVHGRCPAQLGLAVALLLLACVFGWRSSVFYGHMGQAIFGHYLVALDREKGGRTKAEEDSEPKQETDSPKER